MLGPWQVLPLQCLQFQARHNQPTIAGSTPWPGIPKGLYSSSVAPPDEPNGSLPAQTCPGGLCPESSNGDGQMMCLPKMCSAGEFPCHCQHLQIAEAKKHELQVAFDLVALLKGLRGHGCGSPGLSSPLPPPQLRSRTIFPSPLSPPPPAPDEVHDYFCGLLGCWLLWGKMVAQQDPKFDFVNSFNVTSLKRDFLKSF